MNTYFSQHPVFKDRRQAGRALALAASGPSRLLFAAPVGAREAVAMLRPLVDELVCLEMPEPFRAVGLHYDRFEQTSDDEVVRLLAASREG
ncbi:hypothetical protein QEM13_001943 [Pseudomonas putida]|nr:hypothetical protein [Pseudomonas putida]